MRKIINDVIYDTQIDICIAEYSTWRYINDVYYINEDLYKKETGELYLNCKGGAMSKYADYDIEGNGYKEGGGIFPLTKEEAKQWFKQNVDLDSFIEDIIEPEE